MVPAGDVLYLGGEATDGCAMRGRAAIYRLQADGETSLFWTENTLFPGNVAGMQVLDDELLAAVGYERSLGIETRRPSSGGYSKRWGDQDSASREAALLRIDRRGEVIRRANFSAGLAIFVHGLEVIGGRPLLYGTVGGIPAVARQ